MRWMICALTCASVFSFTIQQLSYRTQEFTTEEILVKSITYMLLSRRGERRESGPRMGVPLVLGAGRNSVLELLLHGASVRRGRSSNASQHRLLSMDDSDQ